MKFKENQSVMRFLHVDLMPLDGGKEDSFGYISVKKLKKSYAKNKKHLEEIPRCFLFYMPVYLFTCFAGNIEI